MTVVWARIKQGGKWVYLILPLLLLGAAWLFYRLLAPGTKPGLPPPDDGKLSRALDETRDRLTEANTQATVEIAVARSEEVTTRVELDAVLTNPDAKARRRDLIALRNRHGR